MQLSLAQRKPTVTRSLVLLPLWRVQLLGFFFPSILHVEKDRVLLFVQSSFLMSVAFSRTQIPQEESFDSLLVLPFRANSVLIVMHCVANTATRRMSFLVLSN